MTSQTFTSIKLSGFLSIFVSTNLLPLEKIKDGRSRVSLDALPDESQQSCSRSCRTLPSLLQQFIVPQGTSTKQALISMCRDPYRIALIPHVKCFLLVEGQEANDRPGEGCFRPDRSYHQRCPVMGPHRPDLVESHPASMDISCSRWPSVQSCPEVRNWELMPQVFSNRTTMAFLHNKGSIPHIENSSQMLAWSRLNLSHTT